MKKSVKIALIVIGSVLVAAILFVTISTLLWYRAVEIKRNEIRNQLEPSTVASATMIPGEMKKPLDFCAQAVYNSN